MTPPNPPDSRRVESALPTTLLSADSRVDRLLLATLTFSLFGHALVLAAQLVTSGWSSFFGGHKTSRFFEEPEAVLAQPRSNQDLSERQIEEQLRELSRPSYSQSASSFADGYRPGTDGLGALGSATQIKIGGGASGSVSPAALQSSSMWAAAVDLTNLTVASQGDPVLYSYFGAIREQIQRTANERASFLQEAKAAGVVYVGFVIDRNGAIESAGVVSERSADSPVLQNVAVRIVKASSPFLPFPPSFQESSKAVVVPIEFTLGPS